MLAVVIDATERRHCIYLKVTMHLEQTMTKLKYLRLYIFTQ